MTRSELFVSNCTFETKSHLPRGYRSRANCGTSTTPAWSRLWTRRLPISALITSTVCVQCSAFREINLSARVVYLVHWPIALNPNGNDPFIPTLPNGKRDVLYNWDLKETWRQMEAVYKKGVGAAVRTGRQLMSSRQSQSHWSIQLL